MKVVFEPLKAARCKVQLLITRPSGGRWRYGTSVRIVAVAVAVVVAVVVVVGIIIISSRGSSSSRLGGST